MTSAIWLTSIFGEIIASHAAAVQFVARFRVPTRKSKMGGHVLVGYLVDKTYYQTIKGMVTPMDTDSRRLAHYCFGLLGRVRGLGKNSAPLNAVALNWAPTSSSRP